MADSDASGQEPGDVATRVCTGWDNSDCAGTPACPPRCPRAFDADGRPVLVRETTSRDVDRLVAMYADMETRSFGLPPASADRTAAWIENLHDTGWNLVACIDDTLVGHVAVAPADEPAPKLVVFVAEGHRGRGIGTELLRHAVAHGRARDYERLRLRVERGNHRARSVYTTVGFELAERTSSYLEMAFPMDSPAARDTCRPPRARSESATHR